MGASDCWRYEGRLLSEMPPTEMAHVARLVADGEMFVSCGRPYRSNRPYRSFDDDADRDGSDQTPPPEPLLAVGERLAKADLERARRERSR